MEFIVAFKKTPQGHLVVVTDKELLGKKFKEKNVVLDMSSSFYEGEVMTLEEVKSVLRGAYIIHLTGKNSVHLGKELNIIEQNAVLLVQGIPHAQVHLG